MRRLRHPSTSVNLWKTELVPHRSLPLLDAEPVRAAPLDIDAAERLAAVLKAVAEPTRLRLLSLVAAHPGQEACICDLTAPVSLSQPTVSHHMRVLTDAGLLAREQRGKWAYYRVIPGALESLSAALTGLS
jgi:ArsR family transcriptional regulator, arsenate/arsenite/antimonite-responsive transcriptional repressor